MQKLSKIIILLLIFNISNSFSNDKDEIFNKLKEKYSNLESISFDFKSDNKMGLQASISAKKGNKYRITMKERVIYCNAKTVWNYSIRDKNVLISTFKNLKSGSLEQIFFDFVKNYKAIKSHKSNNSSGKNHTSIELQAIDEKNAAYDSIELQIDDNLSINGIVLVKNYKKESFIISNIKLNEKIDDKYFEFDGNENIEKIDLR